MDITTAFEAVVGGSNPSGGTYNETAIKVEWLFRYLSVVKGIRTEGWVGGKV